MAVGVGLAALVGLVVAAILPAASGGSWSGPLVIASAVLAASGVAKVADPAPAAAALGAVGLPAPEWALRILGVGEVAVGVAATLAGGPVLALAVGVAYGGFAVVALMMSRADGVSSCGCFGATGSRPGILHVVVDAAAAFGALAAALTGAGGAAALVADTPWAGVPALAGVALGAAALVAVLTVAAETLSVATRPATTPTDFHLVDDRR